MSQAGQGAVLRLAAGLSALIMSVMQWIMGAPGIMVLAKGTAVRNCSVALSAVHRWCGCVCVCLLWLGDVFVNPDVIVTV